MKNISIIVPDSTFSTWLTNRLPSSISIDEIINRIGFKPNLNNDDEEKVTNSWAGRINGLTFGIWDYRGVRWSVYCENEQAFRALALIFPELE